MRGRAAGAEYSTSIESRAIHGASPTTEPAFRPRSVTINSTLEDILLMTHEEYRVAFKVSPVKRAKWGGLTRNVRAGVSGRGSVEEICGGGAAISNH